jgi:energy-coupling factor transporter ATP-binding protein EcfA2
VAAGELLLLEGPSGGGKSTLLRALAGLVPHFHGGRFEGRVVVDGLEVLVRQGAASFERWTGVPAPLDVMRAAVRGQ